MTWDNTDSLHMKCAIIALIGLLSGSVAARADTVTVFAASSLKDVLDELISDWSTTSSDTVRAVYGASSAMARQIDQGAPADIFLSANLTWVTWLEERDAISGDVHDIARNALVLIGAQDTAKAMLPKDAILSALATGRLAMANPNAVPAGIYAKQALTSIGLWSDVQHKIAPTQHVRAAMTLVALEEAPLGVVYRTDALVEPRVSIVATFPENAHDTIRYVAAPISGAAASTDFLVWLKSEDARSVFEKYGFGRPEAQDE